MSNIEYSQTMLKIWTHKNFHRFSSTKLLEYIGEKLGDDKLDIIFENEEMLSILTQKRESLVYIYDFLLQLLEDVNPKHILDPWLSAVSPVLYFKADLVKGKCHAYNGIMEEDSLDFEIDSLKMLLKENFKDIEIGKSSGGVLNLDLEFDLILSFPPISIGSLITSRDDAKSRDFATEEILKWGQKLTDRGVLLFEVSNSFFLDEEGKSEMLKNGLYMNAIFCLPKAEYQTHFVMVSKESTGTTFLAKLSYDDQYNKKVIENFKTQNASKYLDLGGFVDFMKFKSFDSYKSDLEMKELVKRIGLPPLLLSEISTSVELINFIDTENVKNLENTIYLPLFGDDPVEYSLSDLKNLPQNYFQIKLDEIKTNGIYVAKYFNSPIGQKLRKSLEVGVIPKISKNELLKSVIFIPDLKTQTQILGVDIKIEELTIRLNELKRNLWKQPNSFLSVSKDLKSINQEDKLESWIDKLPFPISSILWRYYATKENGKRVEHLFHFFEAFSEFQSMIMLSALVQDQAFYKLESHKWIDKDERFKNWYLRATFGSWNVLTSRLSKAIREYLSNNEKKDNCKKLFGNPSESFLGMISNKRIVSVLIEVADLRNKWKGHGGITSEEENHQRLLILENQLNELRRNISDAFDDCKVLSPITSSYENGIFIYKAKELIGARTPFNEITLNSLVPLDRKKLYLFNTEHSRPLELLPFIKFVENSEAIYFYTSIESKKVRWVSYHFEKEAELNQPVDDELFKVFDFLKL